MPTDAFAPYGSPEVQVNQLSFFGPGEDGPEPKPASDQLVKLRVLITVKAAPNPSERYGETVCVAGLSVDLNHPGWLRLYPINFRELASDERFRKYAEGDQRLQH